MTTHRQWESYLILKSLLLYLLKTLDSSVDMTKSEWWNLDFKAHSVIHLSICKETSFNDCQAYSYTLLPSISHCHSPICLQFHIVSQLCSFDLTLLVLLCMFVPSNFNPVERSSSSIPCCTRLNQ